MLNAVRLLDLSPYSTENWDPTRNEINSETNKKRNVYAQGKNFAFGTQRNLYSTDLRTGFALGVTQILKFALGVTQSTFLRF